FLLKRDGLSAWLARRYRLDDLYLGYDYGGEIDTELGRSPAIRRLPDAPAAAATELLLAGKIGATYIGRLEVGPRALGGRSATARPSAVRYLANPPCTGILRRLRRATGLPILVNTSFNVHEEPIINRPAECLRALRDRRIDFVVTQQACYTL